MTQIKHMTAPEALPHTMDELIRRAACYPELLPALEGMMAWAQRVHVSNPGPEILRACNAIAKARGDA